MWWDKIFRKRVFKDVYKEVDYKAQELIKEEAILDKKIAALKKKQAKEIKSLEAKIKKTKAKLPKKTKKPKVIASRKPKTNKEWRDSLDFDESSALRRFTGKDYKTLRKVDKKGTKD